MPVNTWCLEEIKLTPAKEKRHFESGTEITPKSAEPQSIELRVRRIKKSVDVSSSDRIDEGPDNIPILTMPNVDGH